MGRKVGGLYINPKKLGMTATSCSGEMVAFLGCLSQEKNIEHNCSKQKDRLLACVGSQKGKPKNPGNTINHHLQRLGRSKFL
ncbi:uncharacterized protein M6B38_140700 [Iris pallida]|uniref:IMS import disulfide relay-system CHCH-CHCH-like Cx9C domain-containing protein n=1 Tax=Iris pallida TaxID=29817 RepID=A0AAX6FDK9_IRIPA|nr:uncharacterized protein M6B38_140700 [Iris pallida]